MKKIIILLALILNITVNAQAPNGFNYQATVRNSSGALITNQNVLFKFNIMLNSQTSVPIFSETHFAPTDDLGQVNLVIGTGTPTVGTFSTINWANGTYYLGIELNTGNGYVAMGTTQLLSVPYALYANNSGSLIYPDGISGEVVLINSSNSFQVPTGKNFLINYAQNSVSIGNINFNYPYPPVMIAGSGQVVSTFNGGFISGFITNAGVEAVTVDLNTGNYTVPSGKSFVLLAVTGELLINNIDPNPNGASNFPNRPLILGEGTIISCQCEINGYLK